jgi:hypothetical protein
MSAQREPLKPDAFAKASKLPLNYGNATLKRLKDVARERWLPTTEHTPRWSKLRKEELEALICSDDARIVRDACGATDVERQALYNDLMAAHMPYDAIPEGQMFVLFADGSILFGKAHLIGRSLFDLDTGVGIAAAHRVFDDFETPLPGPKTRSDIIAPCIFHTDITVLRPLRTRLLKLFVCL